MSIVINKAAVRRSLEKWFIAARAGQTLSAVETARLSSADASAQSSDFFYDLLCADEDSADYNEQDVITPVALVAAVDLAAGELVQIEPDGRIVPLSKEPLAEVIQPSGETAADFFG